MENNRIYFWVSDYSESTGEGRLGRLFIKYLEKYNEVVKINNSYPGVLNYKYINPIVGIMLCWILFLKKKKVAYINYLPLWNIFIFLLLPPKTIIGPITGGSNFSKLNKDYFIRKYIFPVLYKVSEIILNLRYENIFFATELLKKKLSSTTIKKSKFNFVLRALKIKTCSIKTIDFCLYYRKHPSKICSFPYTFIKKLIKQGYKIYVVGDKLNINGVNNLGFIKYSKLIQILKKTKFTISSPENI